ncbi:hypothetical protein ACFQAS_07170 [Halopenitus salinus]|uniref:Flagellin n=1 Tax=Halopenitus salinus TaxID=1198295 RepID=A0ABD5V1F3_9EURY
MADVRGPEQPPRAASSESTDRPRRDRAQLFLVGAIVLAVLLVALAVLLNAVIYTGNLATRDTGADVAATIEYDDAAHDAALEVFTATNDYADENEANHTQLEANLTGGIGAWETASAEHAAIRGTMSSIENVETTDGYRLQQATNDSFHPNSDDNTTEWDLADSTRVRNYTINATPENQVNADTLNDTDPGNVTDTFFVEFEGDETYYLYLYESDSGDGCTLVHDGTDGIDRACVDGPTFVVNLTADPTNSTATISNSSTGDSSEFNTTFFQDLDPNHSITYHNPGNISGEYDLVVESDDGSVVYDDEPPNSTEVIYDLEYDVVRRSDSLHYRNGTRIAPKEAPYDAS